jgi:hypothetical protein
VLLTVLRLANSFTFLYPFVTPSSLTINSLVSYSFVALREFDVSLNPTPYST